MDDAAWRSKDFNESCSTRDGNKKVIKRWARKTLPAIVKTNAMRKKGCHNAMSLEPFSPRGNGIHISIDNNSLSIFTMFRILQLHRIGELLMMITFAC